MTTLIVTASSKTKAEISLKSFEYADRSFINSIDKRYSEELLKARKSIAVSESIELGPDIIEGLADPVDNEFLPAYIRYTGRTYSRITDDAWVSLNNSDGKFDMVILSAVYGLMRYNEPVRNYNTQQKDKINETRIATFWKNKGAKTWLMNYIQKNNFDDVKFVLSTSYAAIVERDRLIDELRNLGINAEDKQLKSAGRASMLERGSYINDLLLGKF